MSCTHVAVTMEGVPAPRPAFLLERPGVQGVRGISHSLSNKKFACGSDFRIK